MNQQAGLSVVGAIQITDETLKHRFVLEALAVLTLAADEEDWQKRVIGTTNQGNQVELYGWAQNIAAHRDNTGWVYAVCLNPGTTRVFATDERTPVSGPTIEIEIGPGEVFRLNDRFTHWTQDSGPRLAAFLGPLQEPSDELALANLQEAVDRLSSGTYRRAPRVACGFRVLQSDECWATHDYDSRELMLVSEAVATRADIITCAECKEPATTIDHYWPYEQSMNRCYGCRDKG